LIHLSLGLDRVGQVAAIVNVRDLLVELAQALGPQLRDELVRRRTGQRGRDEVELAFVVTPKGGQDLLSLYVGPSGLAIGSEGSESATSTR
jgi:hypothetical protein